MYTIQIYNKIAEQGLSHFDKNHYLVTTNSDSPDAILCRSQNLLDTNIPLSTQVITRAGAGTNNIPIKQCTEMGIPVLNTPGANANAVKELVIASLLIACRNIHHALKYVDSLDRSVDDINQQVEKNKKQFAGMELPGKTLAVIGLGHIGVKVANAARHLGLHVIGYDPAITVQNAWELHASITQAHTIEEAVANADFITIHVPLIEATKDLFSTTTFKKTKLGAVLLNFSRCGIVDNDALAVALSAQQISQYVCDFPNATLLNLPNVICLPHLGASTEEAEINCAVMAVNQIKAYLELGHIEHSVNFPKIQLSKTEGFRLLVINKNIPNMVAQISTVLSQHKLNIIDMINKSRGEIACTLVDVNKPVSKVIIEKLLQIDGVIKARSIISTSQVN